MATIRTLAVETQRRLSEQLSLPIDEARIEARLLLQTAFNVDRAWLLAHENDAPQANIHTVFEALLKRRLQGEPIAYILGKREFYGLELAVTKDTLIPRPDTETLVEATLAKISAYASCSVLDLGTGTGAIAIAIAAQRPSARILAVDRSPKALEVAAANAKNIGLANTQFLLSDWFSALGDERFDVIVSNPPYIAENDPHLDQGDLRFEPRSALAAGPEGLDDIRRIIDEAQAHLNLAGWLMLEHGYDQAEKVSGLMRQAGFDNVTSAADLAEIARVTMGQLQPR